MTEVKGTGKDLRGLEGDERNEAAVCGVDSPSRTRACPIIFEKAVVPVPNGRGAAEDRVSNNEHQTEDSAKTIARHWLTTILVVMCSPLWRRVRG